MRASSPGEPADHSAAVQLGQNLRRARKLRGWTISELAVQLGRPREWLNRIELGNSEYGEYKPATRDELETILDLLGETISGDHAHIFRLGDLTFKEYQENKLGNSLPRPKKFGKLTRTEVIVGEKHIVEAISELISRQQNDSIIRNTGIKNPGGHGRITDSWQKYRDTVGNFLADNPKSLFKSVEYAATPELLERAKINDSKIAHTRPIDEVYNVKIKFHEKNPLNLHVVIGQNEAILALPQTSGQPGSNTALLIRDKVFLEALRIWYDEVMWDMPGKSSMVNFEKYEESFEDIKDMYGFDKQNS